MEVEAPNTTSPPPAPTLGVELPAPELPLKARPAPKQYKVIANLEELLAEAASQ